MSALLLLFVMMLQRADVCAVQFVPSDAIKGARCGGQLKGKLCDVSHAHVQAIKCLQAAWTQSSAGLFVVGGHVVQGLIAATN